MTKAAPGFTPSFQFVALALVLLGWAALVVWAADSGALSRLTSACMPLYAILVATGIAAPVAVYHSSAAFRGLVERVGLFPLTVLHIWRIPAAALFFYYGAQGSLPLPFWVLAGTGDLLAGINAATILSRPRNQARYREIHRFGFVDFIFAVGTGLTLALLHDPRMGLLRTLPMALIPLYGVGISGATHIFAFDLLRKTSAAAGKPSPGSSASMTGARR
jgi:hypothetical protein